MRQAKATIEQRLLDASNHTPRSGSAFVAATMQAIEKKQASETFESVLRTTNATKKERFIMKLKHLPTSALAGLIIAGALVLSGTAYAAYQLWLSPHVSVTQVQQNQFGRTEALVDLQHCTQLDGYKNISAEIKPGSGLSPDEAAKVLQAFCEVSAIQAWAMNDLHADPSGVNFPYTIDEVSSSSLKVSSTGDVRNLSLTKSTKYVSAGAYIEPAAFHTGDSIAYVQGVKSHSTIAIVKLSLPALYYTTQKQNSVTIREACMGNPQDSCLSLEGIGIGPEVPGTLAPQPKGIYHKIQGKLISHNGNTFTLKGSSGDLYTVTTLTDLIARYNAKYSQQNSGITVEIGDDIDVLYAQPKGADPHQIAPDQINEVMLLAEGGGKSAESLHKY